MPKHKYGTSGKSVKRVPRSSSPYDDLENSTPSPDSNPSGNDEDGGWRGQPDDDTDSNSDTEGTPYLTIENSRGEEYIEETELRAEVIPYLTIENSGGDQDREQSLHIGTSGEVGDREQAHNYSVEVGTFENSFGPIEWRGELHESRSHDNPHSKDCRDAASTSRCRSKFKFKKRPSIVTREEILSLPHRARKMKAHQQEENDEDMTVIIDESDDQDDESGIDPNKPGPSHKKPRKMERYAITRCDSPVSEHILQSMKDRASESREQRNGIQTNNQSQEQRNGITEEWSTARNGLLPEDVAAAITGINRRNSSPIIHNRRKRRMLIKKNDNVGNTHKDNLMGSPSSRDSLDQDEALDQTIQNYESIEESDQSIEESDQVAELNRREISSASDRAIRKVADEAAQSRKKDAHPARKNAPTEDNVDRLLQSGKRRFKRKNGGVGSSQNVHQSSIDTVINLRDIISLTPPTSSSNKLADEQNKESPPPPIDKVYKERKGPRTPEPPLESPEVSPGNSTHYPMVWFDSTAANEVVNASNEVSNAAFAALRDENAALREELADARPKLVKYDNLVGMLKDKVECPACMEVPRGPRIPVSNAAFAALRDENAALREELVDARPKLVKYDNLVGVLKDKVECPACMEVPRGPRIPVCPNGHITCSKCLRDTCHICRARMGDGKSMLAVSIIENIPLNCNFQTNGCQVTCEMSELELHEKRCPFRTVKCPNFSCEVKISLAKLAEHTLAKCIHTGTFKSSPLVTNYNYIIGENIHQVEMFDLRRNSTWRPDGITFDGNNFFLKIMRKARKSMWYFYVQMAGTEEQAKQYLATLTVFKSGGMGSIRHVIDACPIDISSTDRAATRLYCCLLPDTTMRQMLKQVALRSTDPANTKKYEFSVSVYLQRREELEKDLEENEAGPSKTKNTSPVEDLQAKEIQALKKQIKEMEQESNKKNEGRNEELPLSESQPAADEEMNVDDLEVYVLDPLDTSC